jgi:hypothetical protein
VIDASEALITPHEAFCRILEVIRPENPGLGKTVTGPHWIYEDRDEADTLACQQALGFLKDNVSAGKIRAEGKRPRADEPVEIRQSELRTGILKVWDGTLEFQMEGRLYRNVFLSMADLNRELGVPDLKQVAPTKVSIDAKLTTGPDFKHDWEGALIEVMAFLHSEGVPDRPKPIVDTMLTWFQSQPSGEPGRSKLYERAKRILDRLKSV